MQRNKIYAWENLDAILYERTFQRNLRLDRVFTITNTKKGMKNTETYMHNKKSIFSLLQKSKKKKKKIKKKKKKEKQKKKKKKKKRKKKKETATTNKQKTKENQMKKVHNG